MKRFYAFILSFVLIAVCIPKIDVAAIDIQTYTLDSFFWEDSAIEELATHQDVEVRIIGNKIEVLGPSLSWEYEPEEPMTHYYEYHDATYEYAEDFWGVIQIGSTWIKSTGSTWEFVEIEYNELYTDAGNKMISFDGNNTFAVFMSKDYYDTSNYDSSNLEMFYWGYDNTILETKYICPYWPRSNRPSEGTYLTFPKEGEESFIQFESGMLLTRNNTTGVVSVNNVEISPPTTPPTTSTPIDTASYGDFNSDGIVDSTDAVVVLRYYLLHSIMETYTDSFYQYVQDTQS